MTNANIQLVVDREAARAARSTQQYQEALRQVKHVTGLTADLQVISLSELTVKHTSICGSERRNRANIPKGSKQVKAITSHTFVAVAV